MNITVDTDKVIADLREQGFNEQTINAAVKAMVMAGSPVEYSL